jgi:hypothetical protein
MTTQFYPTAATAKQAAERRTVYANSVLHLFQSTLVPTAATPLSDYTANEADYDAYAAVTITAFEDPILAPVSGFMIGSPLVQFEVGAADPVVTNLIGGWYLVDSAGVIRLVGIFDTPVPMQIANQGCPVNLYDVFPTLLG